MTRLVSPSASILGAFSMMPQDSQANDTAQRTQFPVDGTDSEAFSVQDVLGNMFAGDFVEWQPSNR